MTNTLTRVAIILVIFWVTTYASCNKNCVESTYSFQIGIKATPNLDSININDTIWLEINESTNLIRLALCTFAGIISVMSACNSFFSVISRFFAGKKFFP